MCPLTAQLPINVSALKVDMGTKVLLRFEKMTASVGSSKGFMLHGEPIAKATDKFAVKGPEPFGDSNSNGMHEEKEPYIDLDGDGQFTEEIYFADYNGNRQHDKGILEKYITGQWAEADIVVPTQPSKSGDNEATSGSGDTDKEKK